jgi:hypothetical protein
MSPPTVTTQSTNVDSSMSYAKFYLAVYPYYYHKRGLLSVSDGEVNMIPFESLFFLLFDLVLHV